MATTTETKIIEIKVPIGEGIKQIKLLTDEIERLRAGQADLKKGSEAEKQQYEKNAIAIKEYTRQKAVLQREVQTEIKDTQSAMSAYQKLQTEYTKAATNAKNLAAAHGVGSEKAKAAADSAFALGQRLKDIDASVNQHQRNVGNYSGALEDLNNKYVNGLSGIQNFITANGGLAGSFRAVGQAALQFGKQLLLLLANPIVATIAAIAGAVMLLVNAMKQNGAATEKFNQILAPFKALIALITTALGQFVSILLDGVLVIGKWANAVMSLIPGLDKIAEKNQEAIRLEREKQKLIREGIVDKAADAKEELRISELKKKIMQADKYSVEQRLAFAREVDKAEKALALDDANRANRNLKNFLDNMKLQGKAQKDYTVDELQQLSDLQAAKYAEQQAYYDKTRRTASREATLIAEIEKEKEAAGKASFEKLKQQQEERAKITQAEEDRLFSLRQYIRDNVQEMTRHETALTDLQKKQLQIVVKSGDDILKAVTNNATAVLNASIATNGKKKELTEEEKQKEIDAANEVKQQKIQNALDTANAGADILQGAFDFTTALGDAELARWAKQNKGKANYDEEYAKKKAELDHKAAVRNKAMQVVNSIINTAGAVVAALPNVPLSIAAGIAGAIQTAAIIATPIPDKDATSSGGGSSPSLPPDLTSKMASPLTNSVQTMGAMGGSNAITSGAANAAISPAFDYNAMAKVMSKLPAPELSIVELRTKERQVDFIDNISTLKS